MNYDTILNFAMLRLHSIAVQKISITSEKREVTFTNIYKQLKHLMYKVIMYLLLFSLLLTI